ncbi:MAG: glycosyltransferase family 2 protein, partial [Caulobacteraceae bacterium]
MADGARNILAVVVTYRPEAAPVGLLETLAGQADAVVVVDNGSPNLADIEAAAHQAGARLIANPANLGVAAALNQAARLARDEGFAWLAMFDQDSSVPPGALAGLLDLRASHPRPNRIAILALGHRDRATGHGYFRAGDILEETPAWRSLRTTITSGSLVRVAAFHEVGFFDEKLFIDGVDHDFCLRCRAAGWLVIQSRGEFMDHALGAISQRRVLGRTVPLSNHPPDRRYYIARNTLELIVRHVGHDPVWAARAAIHLAVDSAAAALLERDRAAKLAAMLQG